MCLVEIGCVLSGGSKPLVKVGNRKIYARTVFSLKSGDFVLIFNGYIVQKLDPKTANEILKLKAEFHD